MAEIRWTVTVEADLQKIETFIARDSPRHAVRTVDRLVHTTERLESFPVSGRVVPEFNREDLREVISGSYRIVYLVQPDSVSILRVVHGARDIVDLAEREPWQFEG